MAVVKMNLENVDVRNSRKRDIEVRGQEAMMETIEQTQKRGRGRPQLRSDEETLALITEAANREFLAHGFAATGMEAVARAAGVSTKTLYRLVPTKTALFESVVTARIGRFTQSIHERVAEKAEPVDSLEALLVECARLTLDPEVVGFISLVVAERRRCPVIASTFYNKGMKRTSGALAAWIGEQAERGLIDVEDRELAAGMLLGMMISEPQRAALLGQLAPPSEAAIRKRAKACARLFLEGCGRAAG
jgi:AcrR family transcriptional regulator